MGACNTTKTEDTLPDNKEPEVNEAVPITLMDVYEKTVENYTFTDTSDVYTYNLVVPEKSIARISANWAGEPAKLVIRFYNDEGQYLFYKALTENNDEIIFDIKPRTYKYTITSDLLDGEKPVTVSFTMELEVIKEKNVISTDLVSPFTIYRDLSVLSNLNGGVDYLVFETANEFKAFKDDIARFDEKRDRDKIFTELDTIQIDFETHSIVLLFYSLSSGMAQYTFTQPYWIGDAPAIELTVTIPDLATDDIQDITQGYRVSKSIPQIVQSGSSGYEKIPMKFNTFRGCRHGFSFEESRSSTGLSFCSEVRSEDYSFFDCLNIGSIVETCSSKGKSCSIQEGSHERTLYYPDYTAERKEVERFKTAVFDSLCTGQKLLE